MIIYFGSGASRSYYYLCISHVKPVTDFGFSWTSQRIYYIARKASDLKPVMLLIDIQFFMCVYEFPSATGRKKPKQKKIGMRGVWWGKGCCVSLQMMNECLDALLIFAYTFLMYCMELMYCVGLALKPLRGLRADSAPQCIWDLAAKTFLHLIPQLLGRFVVISWLPSSDHALILWSVKWVQWHLCALKCAWRCMGERGTWEMGTDMLLSLLTYNVLAPWCL